MYQIYGIKKCLGAFAIITGVIFAVWAFWANPEKLLQYRTIVAGSISISTAITLLFGQTFLFPIVCRWPLIKYIFPDLDGDWTATLESNWAKIQERNGSNSNATSTTPIAARISITARLFHIRINLESLSQYTNSKTDFVTIKRDEEDGNVSLKYMYTSTTPNPLPTDSGGHQGAASLALKKGEDGKKHLQGLYWTNRNWHQGLNTAGTITMRRD